MRRIRRSCLKTRRSRCFKTEESRLEKLEGRGVVINEE
jgi:hypothetical protein